jgi:CHAT domain-containing protein/Flp pilus assembly protein TadD
MRPLRLAATLTVLVLAMQGCAVSDAMVCRSMGKPADCFVHDPITEHPEAARARSMNARAVELMRGARFAESETLLRQALQIVESAVPSELRDWLTISILTNLAIVASLQGRYDEAELLHRRALRGTEMVRGLAPEGAASALDRLAFFYAEVLDRQDEAEVLLRRALAIREQARGPDEATVVESLLRLGRLHVRQRRYAEAEPVLRRALAIPEKAFWARPRLTAGALREMADLHSAQSRHGEAEPLLLRALAIEETALGREHPNVVKTLSGLARLYEAERRYSEAESLHHRALRTLEKIWGREHPELRSVLENLARLYVAQDEFAQAEPLMRRALAIKERTFGPDHVELAQTLNALAAALLRTGRPAEARPLYERARRIHLVVGRVNADLDDDALRALQQSRDAGLREYVAALADIAREPDSEAQPGSAARDAFVAAEQLRGGATHSALVRASARAAAGDPATAVLAREVQDLRNRWRALARLPADERSSATQANARQVEVELTAAAGRLQREFPHYRELTAPEPIDFTGVQRLLRRDEALISQMVLADRVLLWLIRPGAQTVYRAVDIEKEALARRIAGVRASLERLSPFDVAGSHALYALLFAPFEKSLTGVKHLIVVPDEMLLPVPFGALLTRAEGATYAALAELHASARPLSPADLAQYATLPWLTRTFAVTILPSATSLRTLRAFPRMAEAEAEPLIAFGDPVLSGGGRIRGGAMPATRGSTAALDEIRRMDRLPGTRDELIAVAQALGADPARALYLGPRATETMLRQLDTSGRLGRARVVSFATHGLIAGELKGVTQPALVLTPPEASSADDDGLLSLDEVLRLRLASADWVVLSACNTAAGDGSGESLTGLARAFFFAGARSLLVSYWSVEDRATQALMTEVFKRYARDRMLSRAEVLRQAMLELMQRAEGPFAYFAHPFAWAPFFLVGEGAGEAN